MQVSPIAIMWPRLTEQKAQRSIRRVVSVVLIVSALLFSLGSPCLATTQQVVGTITDTLGRPLAKVGIQLYDANGQVIAHGVSGPGGRFRIATPAPGT